MKKRDEKEEDEEEEEGESIALSWALTVFVVDLALQPLHETSRVQIGKIC